MLVLLALLAATQSTQLASLDSVARTRHPAPPAAVEARRASAAVTIDGRLEDAVWRNAVPVRAFHQRDPIEGAVPSESTVVYVAYDDAALYVGARMYDRAPDSVVARLSRRDDQVNADAFTVYLDPYHDGRTGFYFGLTASGVQSDGTVYNDVFSDDTWDGVWEGAARRDSAGWTAEFRIPFSQLRFRSGAVLTWGINFERDIARNNESDWLVYMPRNGSGFVSRFPELVGLSALKPPRRIEVVPYATTRAEFQPVAAGDPFNGGSRYTPAVGADFKLGLGTNLTLDGTVNPDFGQVEVDPAVVNLSAFETFFEEKRPFFVEGADIFRFGRGGANNNWGFNWANPSFFYSRRIGRSPQVSLPAADFADEPTATRILGAAKLSGRIGPNWTLGVMQAVTSSETARLSTGGVTTDAQVEPAASYSVIRSQKEFNNGGQALGIIATGALRRLDDPAVRDQVNSSAYSLGLDGWTFLDSDRKWVLTGWAGASRVSGDPARITALQESSLHYYQRPDVGYLGVDSAATSLSGASARVALNKQKGDWTLNSALGIISPGFDVNDLGFQFRSDVINAHVVGGHRWTQPGRVLRSASLNLAGFRTWDFGGDVTWTGLFLMAHAQLHNYYKLSGTLAWNPPTTDIYLTRGGPAAINPSGIEADVEVESDNRKAWFYSVELHTQQYRLGSNNSWSVSPSVTWQPTPALSVSAGPSLSHLFTNSQYVGTFADSTARATFGNRYVFGDLRQTELSASLRLNYIFTPRLSLQLYAQPLVSSNGFSNYKELARPRSYQFNRYGDGASTFDSTTGVADPDGPGPAAPITIGNPSFTLASLRGNAVLRWEYLPGSTLYLVWTQNRSNTEDLGTFGLGRSIGNLFDQRGDNTFAVKISYWWNP